MKRHGNLGYKVYMMRWTIEVLFHDAKRQLNLREIQTLSFASHIAAITTSMLQYKILSCVKSFDAYETIGDFFKQYNDQIVELSATESILKIVLSIISTISSLLFVDENKLIQLTINKKKDSESLS